MKESMGLVPTLSIIIFAVVLLSGYLAFTLNYSKAYKANSKIVNIIQKHKNDVNSSVKEIDEYLESINYVASTEYTSKCSSDGYETANGSRVQGWCYKIISTENDEKEKGSNIVRKYVKVRTYMSIDLPLLNKILPNLNISKVDGATKSTIIY